MSDLFEERFDEQGPQVQHKLPDALPAHAHQVRPDEPAVQLHQSHREDSGALQEGGEAAGAEVTWVGNQARQRSPASLGFLLQLPDSRNLALFFQGRGSKSLRLKFKCYRLYLDLAPAKGKKNPTSTMCGGKQ